MVESPDDGGQRAVLPLLDRQRRSRRATGHADEPFAGRADEHRHTGGGDHVGEPGQEREVVGHGLAEPEARIGDELVVGDAGSHGRLTPLRQEGPDLGDDVVVAGLELHGGRRPLHVHEDVSGAGPGDERQHGRIAPPGGDVVDHGGAGVEGGGGHRGVGGVDADGDPGLGGEAADDGHDPPALLLGRYRLRPRPGRLAPHVEDGGAGGGKLEAMFDGPPGVEEAPAVGERVRRHVDDPHHRRPLDPTHPRTLQSPFGGSSGGGAPRVSDTTGG